MHTPNPLAAIRDVLQTLDRGLREAVNCEECGKPVSGLLRATSQTKTETFEQAGLCACPSRRATGKE